jgi:hypothetical protein
MQEDCMRIYFARARSRSRSSAASTSLSGKTPLAAPVGRRNST